MQAPAHRAVVHAAGDRVGPSLGARAHERERSGRLIDERHGELDRVLGIGLRAHATHEHHDHLDLASYRQRQQQCAAGLPRLGEPRQRRGQLTGFRGKEAAPRARHPAHASRALRTGRQITQPPVALGEVHVDELVLGGRFAEMVHVHLLGPGREQQLPGEPPEDPLAVVGAVGQQRQPPHAGQQRIGARGLLVGVHTPAAHIWNCSGSGPGVRATCRDGIARGPLLAAPGIAA